MEIVPCNHPEHEPAKTNAEEATRFADTCRLYREAEESLAGREAANHGRLFGEELLYKGYIEDFRKKAEVLAKPKLIEQINDPTQVDNLDRTRWQLAVAEILASNKTDVPMARKLLGDAEGTVKRLPASEQVFYRPQIDRIVRLLPKG